MLRKFKLLKNLPLKYRPNNLQGPARAGDIFIYDSSRMGNCFPYQEEGYSLWLAHRFLLELLETSLFEEISEDV